MVTNPEMVLKSGVSQDPMLLTTGRWFCLAASGDPHSPRGPSKIVPVQYH